MSKQEEIKEAFAEILPVYKKAGEKAVGELIEALEGAEALRIKPLIENQAEVKDA